MSHGLASCRDRTLELVRMRSFDFLRGQLPPEHSCILHWSLHAVRYVSESLRACVLNQHVTAISERAS